MTKYLFSKGLFLMFVHSKAHKNASKFFIIILAFFFFFSLRKKKKDSISQLDLTSGEKSLGIHLFPSQHNERKAWQPLQTFFSWLKRGINQ